MRARYLIIATRDEPSIRIVGSGQDPMQSRATETRDSPKVRKYRGRWRGKREGERTRFDASAKYRPSTGRSITIFSHRQSFGTPLHRPRPGPGRRLDSPHHSHAPSWLRCSQIRDAKRRAHIIVVVAFGTCKAITTMASRYNVVIITYSCAVPTSGRTFAA
jgi:hypothetical protein